MSEPDLIRLRHMLDAAQEAVSIAGGRPLSELVRDRTATLAVMKTIEIIGEAASKVGLPLREAEPDVPWSEIVGMRNRLIHAYFDVTNEVVWETVQEDLPTLIRQLTRILSRSEP